MSLALPVPVTPAPLRTLFLQAPSFDGFDGGAGSRYQAKREIKSFWYPDLAGAAGGAGAGLAACSMRRPTTDGRADARRSRATTTSSSCTPAPRRSRPMRSSPSCSRQDNPRILIGLVGAKTMVDPEGSLKAAHARSTSSCREEFDYTCKEVADGRAARGHHGALATAAPTARIVHNPPRADDREHGRAAVRRAGLQARSEDRELLHRLSEASLRQLLHRARLPLEVHVLPVAADRRRPPLSGALGRERHRGGEAGSRRTCPR